MKLRKHTKSFFGILLALIMVVTMMPSSLALAEELTGSITLKAPEDPSDEYVDLGEMTVTAYQILDEANSVKGQSGSMFTVNKEFQTFFETVTKDFYTPDKGFWESDGKLGDNKTMYLTYDEAEQTMKVSSTPQDHSISVTVENLRSLIRYQENKEYFAAALMEEILTANSTSYESSDHLITNTDNAKMLSVWLRNFAKAKSISGKTQKVTPGEGTGDSIVFDDLPLGYWLLVSDNAPSNVANVETVFRLSQQDGVADDVDAQLKLENQELEKKVKNANHADGAYPDAASYQNETTAEAGDILNYEITAKVPNLPDYDGSQLLDGAAADYTYQFSDTLHNQRLVNGDGSVVSDGNPANDPRNVFTVTITYQEGGSEKTITLKDEEGVSLPDYALKTYLKQPGGNTYGTYDGSGHTQNFVLDFDVEKLSELAKSLGGDWKEAKMTVTYSAELSSDAVLRNDNDVTLNYSNDPRKTAAVNPPEEKTKVYSYGFAFEKQFEPAITYENGDYSNLAKDVVFQLYPAEGYDGSGDIEEKLGGLLKVVKDPDDGSYRKADQSDEADAVTDLKLDTSTGQLKVYGLDAGYYVLKETSSPSGYARIKEIIVYLDPSGTLYLYDSTTKATEGDVTLGTGTDNANYGEADPTKTENYLHFTVTNRQGMNLPETGGAGVWMLLIGGVLLITLAGALVLSRKKNNLAE